ncbi:S53 family peptidase, partial [Picrophilus oshimae]
MSRKIIIAVFLALVMILSAFALAMGSYNAVSTNKPENVYNVPPPDYKAFNLTGSANPSMTVSFEIYVPLYNYQKLESIANAVSTPGNPMYHKFLSYNDIEKEFINMAQYNKDLNYLKDHGFKILSSSAPIIVASGTVSMVESYLGMHVNIYSNKTESFYYGFGTPKIGNTMLFIDNISRMAFERPSTLITQKQAESMEKKLNQNETFPFVAYSPKYLEQVYNATGMYSMGYNGSGQSIGILDFYGDPFIKEELAYFDHEFNISAPPSFKIVPIGPYYPYEGIETGWAGEISLDVESSHTMAPGANITLYIANGNCPLSAAISYINSQDRVDDLSQSFSIPDSCPAIQTSALAYYQCEVVTNIMYAMGSAEGITFSASSGDAGASGYSIGALGSVGYPSTSPYVAAVGGTSTYLDFQGEKLISFNQTAWSNYGFVPPEINYGGSTGGVSILQPRPYYQDNITGPSGYPYGKMIPDLSFEATVFPGFLYVMPGNETCITGGTSEASPILAGLMTLVDEYNHGKIGMIDPSLYYLGEHDYKNVFIPVDYGYNIPFTAHYGYNLVTGWGSLNIANFAMAYKSMKLNNTLSIQISTEYMNSTNQNMSINETGLGEYMPGQNVTIIANITYNKTEVTSGTFEASLTTMKGILKNITMHYNSTLNRWIGYIIIPEDANGPSFIAVHGNYNKISGENEVSIFSGYYLEMLEPYSTSYFSTSYGLEVIGHASYLNGTIVKNYNVSAGLYAYSIFNNTYYKVAEITMMNYNGTLIGEIHGNYPDTPSLIIGDNAFAYTPFMNGPYLQDSIILGPNVVEPGAVGAGQYIFIEPAVIMPENQPSLNDMLCSNVTFELYNPDHVMVSKAVTRPYEIGYPASLPELYVPKNSMPGLYTILINASYDSSSYGYINGTFYGQIYVSNYITPRISMVNYTYEGQKINIYANISYPNGTEVRYGMYSLTFYPAFLSSEYYDLTEITQINMNYNESINMWSASVELPSYYNDGSFGKNYLNIQEIAELPPGPYYAFVSGVSANGYPTTTSQSSEHFFYIEPYQFIGNKTLKSLPVNNGLALMNDNINVSGS